MVLLHGPAAYGASWLRVIPQLTTTNRVIAPDLPGHGTSAVPDGGLDAGRMLSWFGDLIQQTCPAPPVVVGQLVGGAIAARFAADHREPLERLVLVVPFGLAPFQPTPEFGAALNGFLTQPSESTHEELWDHCVFDLQALRRQPEARWEQIEAYNLHLAAEGTVFAALRALMDEFGLAAIPGSSPGADHDPDEPDLGTARLHRPARHRRSGERPVRVAAAGDREHGQRARVRVTGGIPARAPGGGHIMTGGTIAVARREGAHAALTPEQLDGLAARLDGRVLMSGEDGWDEAVLIWNRMAATEPALVVQPASAGDVAVAIGFARDHGLLVSVKGGGHNIAGTSIADRGLALDMSLLRDVTVDPEARVAHVGPGCRLQDVDRATQAHGLATVLGFVSDVGVAGLTLGGGLGYLTRRFGWGVDNLLEVELVTADGELRTAGPSENADLFWALRGGGGNFGIVTRFTFRLHEVGPTVFGGLIAWPFERADEIFRAYRTFTAHAPRELAAWHMLLHAPPAPFVPEEWHGEKVCAMAVCYSGDLARAEEALAPIRSLGEPVIELLSEQPYVQVQSYLDDVHPKGMHYYWRTEYLAGLSDGLVSALPELYATCPMPGAELGVLHLEGALNRREEDDGAVGNRDARYVLGVLGMWEPDEPCADEFGRWIRDTYERLRPFTTGRTYVNFQTADEGDERVRASYGENYARLAAIKQKYDPENLFRSNRNIRPAS